MKMMKNSIISEVESDIEALMSVRPLRDLQERFEIVRDLNEQYYKRFGDNLPNYLLSKLSDWLLMEILIDRDVDKVSNSEFAILSHRQLRRRDKRENSVEGGVMDYLNLKYVKNKDSLAKKVKKESE